MLSTEQKTRSPVSCTVGKLDGAMELTAEPSASSARVVLRGERGVVPWRYASVSWTRGMARAKDAVPGFQPPMRPSDFSW